MLAGKIVKGLEVSHFNLPRILKNKVTEGAEAGAKAVEQAVEKTSEQTAQTLEHMPTKQDLVIVPIKDRLVSAGPAHSPFHQSYGLAGFPEKIQGIANTVEKKLATYLKIIPENSKMTKPIVVKLDGVPIELFVDKTSKNITRVTLKQSAPAQSIVLKDGPSSTILDIEFDKSGKMINGSLHIGNNKVSEAYRFSRTDKNMRRIDHENVYNGHSYDHITYKPDGGSETWKPIKDNENRVGTELPRLSSEYVLDEPLGCLFFKLTGLKNTII